MFYLSADTCFPFLRTWLHSAESFTNAAAAKSRFTYSSNNYFVGSASCSSDNRAGNSITFYNKAAQSLTTPDLRMLDSSKSCVDDCVFSQFEG